MKLTTNYNLKKPEGSDTVNIEDFNYNSDIIDNELNTINTKLDEALQLGVNAKDNVVQAINSKKTVPKVTNDNNWESLSQSIRNIKEGSGNAVTSDVLAGKTFTNNDGVEYTGTMVNRGGATTVTPTTSNQTKAAGYYSGAITIKGDSNLVASNILSGKSIFGVKGNVVAGTRWARGTGTYTNVPHPSGSKRYVARVSGLSFTPKYVIVSSTDSEDITLGLSSSAQFTDTYSKDMMYYMKSTVYASGSSYPFSGNPTVYYMKSGTFSVMIRNDEDKAYAFEWIAFEG